MIRNQHKGQMVSVHYAKKKQAVFPWEGATGKVAVVGKRPKNALVVLDTGDLVVFPAGNLLAAWSRTIPYTPDLSRLIEKEEGDE